LYVFWVGGGWDWMGEEPNSGGWETIDGSRKKKGVMKGKRTILHNAHGLR